MRVTRQNVPPTSAPEPASRLAVPAIEWTPLWLALALLGATLAVALPSTSTAIAGVVLVGVGCHRLGFHDARRGGPAPDARVERLSRELRSLGEYVVGALPRRDGAAPAVSGPAPEPPADEPRPLGRVRGGGRPGSIGSIPAPGPLDAPLAGEDPRAFAGTEA